MFSRLFLATLGILLLANSAFATPRVVPEIDAGSANAALTILVGSLALLRERFRK
jgi:hypothetical protein